MKNYFLKLSIVGIISEFLVAALILKGVFWDIVKFNNGAISICILLSLILGGVATLITARVLDRTDWKQIHWKAMIPAPIFIFLAGILVGSLVSYIGHSIWVERGGLFNQSNFNNYFNKPVYWFALIGVPCCLILGGLYRVFIMAIINKKGAVAPS